MKKHETKLEQLEREAGIAKGKLESAAIVLISAAIVPVLLILALIFN